jgi:hypothetical protein
VQKEAKLVEAAYKDVHEIPNGAWMKQFTCGYGAIRKIKLFPVEIAVARLDARTREILAVPSRPSSSPPASETQNWHAALALAW